MSALSDVRGMKIPNGYSFFIAIAFFAAFLAAQMANATVFGNIMEHLWAGVLLFGVTFAMYSAKMLGAGDSKLASAFALWVGFQGLFAFLFYTAILGGLVAVATLLIGRFKPFKAPQDGSWFARAQAGERVVPYGIAIFGGALVSFMALRYLVPELADTMPATVN
ncbi:MAG: prepilin peptidase [Alphaproteobacteria bacterium]|nr:prepilin peptidase [Alphaproteobacteria bacterium]